KITVYSDDSERVESYVNEIPTQIKGTEVEFFSEESCTYQLDMVHYKNYYKRGGCLLLVVEILKTEETKIFFKPLLLRWTPVSRHIFYKNKVKVNLPCHPFHLKKGFFPMSDSVKGRIFPRRVLTWER